MMEGNDNIPRGRLFSRTLRTGRRTYFFDVKASANNIYYLTITESRRRLSRDGTWYHEKHKILLYRQEFDSFLESLQQAMDYIIQNQPDIPEDNKRFYHDEDKDDNEFLNFKEDNSTK